MCQSDLENENDIQSRKNEKNNRFHWKTKKKLNKKYSNLTRGTVTLIRFQHIFLRPQPSYSWQKCDCVIVYVVRAIVFCIVLHCDGGWCDRDEFARKKREKKIKNETKIERKRQEEIVEKYITEI